jgi:hypothetical protein
VTGVQTCALPIYPTEEKSKETIGEKLARQAEEARAKFKALL